jgi:hypothetical protein
VESEEGESEVEEEEEGEDEREPPSQRWMLEHTVARVKEGREGEEDVDAGAHDLISPMSLLSSKASSPNRAETVRLRQRHAARRFEEDEEDDDDDEEEEEEYGIWIPRVPSASDERGGSDGANGAISTSNGQSNGQSNSMRGGYLATGDPADTHNAALCQHALEQAQYGLKLVSTKGLTELALSSVVTSATPATGDLQRRVCLQGLPSHVPRQAHELESPPYSDFI